MKRSIGFVLVCGVILVVGWYIITARNWYKQGIQFMDDRMFEDAAKEFQRIIRARKWSPFVTDSQQRLATCEQEIEAKKLFTEAESLKAAGKHVEAILKYNRVVTQFPSSEYRTQAEEAAAHCQRIVYLSNISSVCEKAEALIREDKLEAALKVIDSIDADKYRKVGDPAVTGGINRVQEIRRGVADTIVKRKLSAAVEECLWLRLKEAKGILESVDKEYPGTEGAEQARALLKTISYVAEVEAFAASYKPQVINEPPVVMVALSQGSGAKIEGELIARTENQISLLTTDARTGVKSRMTLPIMKPTKVEKLPEGVIKVTPPGIQGALVAETPASVTIRLQDGTIKTLEKRAGTEIVETEVPVELARSLQEIYERQSKLRPPDEGEHHRKLAIWCFEKRHEAPLERQILVELYNVRSMNPKLLRELLRVLRQISEMESLGHYKKAIDLYKERKYAEALANLRAVPEKPYALKELPDGTFGDDASVPDVPIYEFAQNLRKRCKQIVDTEGAGIKRSYGAVDRQVDSIAANTKHRIFYRPRMTGGTTTPNAALTIRNAAEREYIVSFSGPEAKEFTVPPRGSQAIDIEPGTYGVAARTADGSSQVYGLHVYEAGCKYTAEIQ